MKTIITELALLLVAFTGFAHAQVSSTEEAFALAKASGRSVFLIGGLKN